MTPRISHSESGKVELGDASVGNISMQIEVTEVDSPLTPSEVAAEQEEARQALLSTADSETPGFVNLNNLRATRLATSKSPSSWLR
jgi:hypothetical protein